MYSGDWKYTTSYWKNFITKYIHNKAFIQKKDLIKEKNKN